MKKTFDIFSVTSKDDFTNPVFQGVFYDPEGWAVASDNCMLVATANDYKPERAGEIRRKNGLTINGKFPEWQKIVPDNRISVKINTAAFRQVCEAFRLARPFSALCYPLVDLDFVAFRIAALYGGHPLSFNVRRLEKMLDFMDAYGTDEIRVSEKEGGYKRVVATGDARHICVLMPVLEDSRTIVIDGATGVPAEPIRGKIDDELQAQKGEAGRISATDNPDSKEYDRAISRQRKAEKALSEWDKASAIAGGEFVLNVTGI